MDSKNFYGELAQQQIRSNQQRSLSGSDDKLLCLLMAKKYNDYLDVVGEFKFFNSLDNLDEDLRDEVIEKLIQYIGYCERNKFPLMGKLGDCSFSYDSNSNMITVSDRSNVSSLSICNGDVYFEYGEEASRRVHYRKEGKYNVPVQLTKTVYLIDDEEINEILSIRRVKDTNISDDEMKDVLSSYASKYGYIVIDKNSVTRNELDDIVLFGDVLREEKEITESKGEFPEGFYQTYLDWRNHNHYALNTEMRSDSKEKFMKNSQEFKKKALIVASLIDESIKKYNNNLEQNEELGPKLA